MRTVRLPYSYPPCPLLGSKLPCWFTQQALLLAHIHGHVYPLFLSTSVPSRRGLRQMWRINGQKQLKNRGLNLGIHQAKSVNSVLICWVKSLEAEAAAALSDKFDFPDWKYAKCPGRNAFEQQFGGHHFILFLNISIL